jgi:TfoX/Sxy family transcriptional regulator of competence genes
MAYDEKLANKIRGVLSRKKSVYEMRMFGGLAFMLRGRMCCGVIRDNLVIRVEKADYPKLLSKPHVKPMNFTGRPLTGFLYVRPGGYKTTAALKMGQKSG